MFKSGFAGSVVALSLVFGLPAASTALATYKGTGPACVTDVAPNDRLNVRTKPRWFSRKRGSLGPGQCGFNIESVKGRWTYIRGSDRGRNVEGWVRNRFLRADTFRDNDGTDYGTAAIIGGYRGTRAACVTGVARYDRLNVRSLPRANSRKRGSLHRRDCNFNIEAVRGGWTYIRGADRGRRVEGWVRNKFLRAASDNGSGSYGGGTKEAGYRGTGPACVTGVSRYDRLNVRARPRANSRRRGSLAWNDCQFTIESVDGRWTFVRGSDRGRRVAGWVRNRHLRASFGDDSGDFGGTKEAGYHGSGPACVTGVSRDDRLNVRSLPRANSRKRGSLAPGQCGFSIESVNGRWTYIRGSDRGRRVQGWVRNRYLKPDRGSDYSGGGFDTFPIRAASGGGQVRRGPGRQYRKIAELRELEPVTVLGRSGNYEGYPWFEIRFRNGRRGYQWGGLVCSTRKPLAGTFSTCERYRRSLSRNDRGGDDDRPQRRKVSFSCNEGIPLEVTFVENGASSFALFSHDSGPRIRVASRRTGSGFRYSNGYHELRGQGRYVDVIEAGQTLDSCVRY